tara:strand:+ start:709 stop:1050 length:342 start_codon:yes stop_codon:yes gene_type:complete
MSDFVWCHGSKCHKNHTMDRVRGTKGSKVLRTRKVKRDNFDYTKSMYGYGGGNVWNYFCSHNCFMDFAHKHAERLIAIEPRNEPLETPINDPEKSEGYYGWRITERGVDNSVE